MFTTYSKEDLQVQTSDCKKTLIDTPENELSDKYDLDRCINWIRENNYHTTCLQFPEALLNDGTSIAFYLQDVLGRPVYMLADTSYGSCCVDEVAAEHVDADSIIHFGHSCLSPVIKLPVLYVFEKKNLNISKLYDSCEVFQETVIIFYDVTFHHLHSEFCSRFENKKNVKVSSLCLNSVTDNSKETICGRIYNKDSDENVSAVFIGDDCITLQNLVLALPDFKWYRYSEEHKLEEYNINRSKFLMQRSHLVEKIKTAKVIGILIGTLGIKNYLDAVDKIKLLVKQNGKKFYTLAVGKPNIAKLANFPEIDVFVYIACQENSLLKDFKDYYKPVVSMFEIEMALGDRPYSMEYTSDFRQLLPGGSFYREIKQNSENSSDPNENSQELLEKHPGTMTEYAGAEFLMSRTWRGLEQYTEGLEVCKAVKGRSGIPQGYTNELETLSEEKPSSRRNKNFN